MRLYGASTLQSQDSRAVTPPAVLILFTRILCFASVLIVFSGCLRIYLSVFSLSLEVTSILVLHFCSLRSLLNCVRFGVIWLVSGAECGFMWLNIAILK